MQTPSTHCWAWVLPGAALLTCAAVWLLTSAWFALVTARPRSFGKSCAGLLLAVDVLCLMAFSTLPLVGYAGLLLSNWLGSASARLGGAGEGGSSPTIVVCFFCIQLLFAGAVGSSAFLLSRAAQQPGCSGGAAAWPALVGVAAPFAALALPAVCCGGCALLASALQRHAQQASKSVADEGAPSVTGSDTSIDEAPLA